MCMSSSSIQDLLLSLRRLVAVLASNLEHLLLCARAIRLLVRSMHEARAVP